MPGKSRATIIGNSVVLTLLIAISLCFVLITEGTWWPADPPAIRWIWASISLTAYTTFSILIAGRRKRPKFDSARTC